jgi:hypothetical protein
LFNALLGNSATNMGRYLIVWTIELSDEKNQKQKYTMAFGGHHTQIKMQQPIKNMRA